MLGETEVQGSGGSEGPVTSCGTKNWEKSSLTLGIRQNRHFSESGVPGNASGEEGKELRHGRGWLETHGIIGEQAVFCQATGFWGPEGREAVQAGGQDLGAVSTSLAIPVMKTDALTQGEARE